MKNRIAVIFIFLFSIVAFLPLVQQAFGPIKLAGLQGAFESGEPQQLTWTTWINGTFQAGTDQYLKYNTAFNGELVRLRNQVEYSVFGNINTILTLGKENYIFDPNYILSREGKNLLDENGRNKKQQTVLNAEAVLDSLNVPLLVIFAPNKANYFFEYLPGESVKSTNTNHDFFKDLVNSQQSHVIDFDDWFLKLKQHTPYPLIPKYGAHWSTYGAALAADSMMNMIEQIIGRKCVSFEISSIETSAKPRFTDDDYLASLNLMQKFESPVLAYPKLQFNTGYKPNVLVISDSFVWNFYDLGIVQNAFDDRAALWYYQKTLYDKFKNNLGPLPGKIIKDDLAERDVIILLISDPGLTDFGYGFFEQLSEVNIHE